MCGNVMEAVSTLFRDYGLDALFPNEGCFW